jgi:hypothetical protein
VVALARLLDRGHGLAGFHAVFLIALAAALVSVVVTLALPARARSIRSEVRSAAL